METYTVILLYPDFIAVDDTTETYIDAVEAEDGYAAARQVQGMVAEATEGEADPEDFRVIAVILGDAQVELGVSHFR